MKNKRRSVLCILFIVLSGIVMPGRAGDIQPRVSYGSRLEPRDGILHGAGVGVKAFQPYWNIFRSNSKPVLYMTFMDLRRGDRPTLHEEWERDLTYALLQFQGTFLMPQIGLSMTPEGFPEQHYEQDVANGRYDPDIESLVQSLTELALPSYIRIGYNFNDKTRNGYEPPAYKSAYRRIAEKIRQAGLETALVWSYSAGGEQNFTEYYPGDEWVDWWAIDALSPGLFSNSQTTAFLDSAAAHGKPVLIADATPRYIGVEMGKKSWQDWFAPFFDLIHKSSQIKGFCYMNVNWVLESRRFDWGDCRLEHNSIVKSYYTGEMDSTVFIPSGEEAEFRQRVLYGPAKPLAISPIAGPRCTANGYPVIIEWPPVNDRQSLAHYTVLKDNNVINYTRNVKSSDFSVKAGESIQYQVSAMILEGQQVPASEILSVRVSNPLNKVLNGSFDTDFAYWNLETFSNGQCDLDFDSSSPLAGFKSAKITITRPTGTDWHIRLSQRMRIYKDMKYTLNLKARANQNVSTVLVLQQDHDPFESYLWKELNLTDKVQNYSMNVNNVEDDAVWLALLAGNCDQRTMIWLDDVSIQELNPNVPVDGGRTEERADADLVMTPNPTRANTYITFTLQEKASVTLVLSDILGKKIMTVFKGTVKAGPNQIQLDCKGLASGVYVVSLKVNGGSEIRRDLTVLR